MKSIDIRSEAAVNLLAEFLDMDTGNNGGGRKNAEHFAHGEFCFVLIIIIFLACFGYFMEYDYGSARISGSTSQGSHTFQPKPIAI
jgi:hypothetical protein